MALKKDTTLKIDNGIDDDVAFPLTHLGQIQVSIDDTTKLQTYLENTYIRFSDVSDTAEFLMACATVADMRTHLNVYSKEEADALFSNPTQIEMSAVIGLDTALAGKVNSNQVLTNVPANALFTDTIYTLTKEAIEETLTGLITSHSHPSDNTWRGVVNDLTTGGIAVSLSAEQGKVLKGLIDNINTILGVDNLTLDSLQEVIDFIEANRDILDALTISNIAGLQNALDNKVNINQVLTDVPAGAVFTDTVYIHPASHPISFITNLQQELDNKVDNSRVLTPVPLGAVFTDTDTIYTHPDSHPISMITGLQAALDSKVPANQVLTPVPLNAIFTDTIYVHPSNHPISFIEGLQAALDSKAPSHSHPYLSTGGGDLTRGTSGDILRLIASPTELDIALLIGLADGNNSFRLKYWGTGVGNTNAITLESSTKTLFHSYQDGIVNFPNGLKLQGIDIVKTNDARLSDARAPLAHDQAISTIVGLQAALDGKVANSRVLTDVPAGAVFVDTWRPVLDNLVSTSQTSSLSANQGRILKGMIDAINTLLLSDTTDLDTIQEIVDFIEMNKATLDTLGISNIAGLQAALDNKVNNSRVLTDVPENAVFTDTVYTHPASHDIAFITGLQAALDGKAPTHTHPYRLDTWVPAWTDVTGKPLTFAPIIGSGAGDAVAGNDPRLTDARTPLAHNQAWSTITSTPTTLSGYGITNALANTGGNVTGALVMYSTGSTSPELKFQNSTFIVGIDLFNNTQRLRFIDRTNAVSRIEFDLSNGSIYAGTIVQATNFYISNANTKLSEGSADSIRLSTPSGYIDIGPQNTAWAHIQTDRANFYFNKGMSVDGNITVYGNQTTVIENSTGYIKELGQRVFSPNNKPTPKDVDYMGAVANFDTDFKQGQYYLAGEYTGAPVAGVLYGKLIVEVSSHDTHNGTSNWVWQTLEDTSGRIWKRHKVNASAWTTWRLWYNEGLMYERGTRVYSPNNKPTMADLGGRTASEITSEIATALSDLIAAAPGTMDTLNELAAALGDDPNFATTMTNALAGKLSLSGGVMTGNIDVSAHDIAFKTLTFNWTGSTKVPIIQLKNATNYGIFYHEGSTDKFYFAPSGETSNYALEISSNGLYHLGNKVIVEGDIRLTDARTPLEHTHPYLPLVGGTMTGKITTPNGAMGIRLGDDSEIGDINIANTFGLKGVQNATIGYIRFGNSTLGLGWDGTKHVIGTDTIATREWVQSQGFLVDTIDDDNYIDSVSFNTADGVLTLGRTGSLADLTVDLDGRYPLIAHNHNAKDINFYVAGTGTVAGTWLGTIDGLTEYYDGLTIRYRIPIAGASTTTLNINNLGAVTVQRYVGSSNITTHFPVNAVITMTKIGSSWVVQDWYDSTDDYGMRWITPVIAGVEVTQYKIVMEGTDGKFYPLTIGNTTAATKTVSTVNFRINGMIMQYGYSGTIAANGALSSYGLWTQRYVDGQVHYTFNQSSGFTAYYPVFLKGTIQSDDTFKLDNTTLTSWLTQTLPTTEDGFVYIKLGYMHNTTTAWTLTIDHPAYHYKNGALRVYVPTHTHAYLADNHDASAVTSTKITNWDTAYSWGNHAGLYAAASHDHTILKEGGTISYGTPGLQWRDVSGVGGTGGNGTDPQNPYDDWFHHLIMNHANAGGYYTDIITAFHQDRIFFKKVANGAQGTIREIYHTGNIPTPEVIGAVALGSDSSLQATLIVDQNGNVGNIAYEISGGCYIPRPLGGHYVTTSDAHTGGIAIKLPTASWNQSDMISFWVDIFDYAGDTEGETISIHIYGYQYSTGSWVNTGAMVLSDRTDKNYTVRFGNDGTRPIVYIGETNTTWNYPQINVRDFQAGYSANYANYDNAFAITFETTFLNVVRTSTDNYPVAKSHTHAYLPNSGAATLVQAAELGSYVGSVNTLQINQQTASKDAFMTFHISNDYAVHFGLDYATNDLFVGGWSMGAVKNKIWHAGNFTDNHSNWDTAYGWGNHASVGYLTALPSHTHNLITGIDDRDVKPNVISYSRLQLYFTSLEGLTGAAGSDWQDFLVLNSYQDSSGEDMNALAFDKSEMKIRHYFADQAATSWGTPKTLAYEEDHVPKTGGTFSGLINFTGGLAVTTTIYTSNISSDASHLNFVGLEYVDFDSAVISGAGKASFNTDLITFAIGEVTSVNRIQTYSTGPTIRFLNPANAYATIQAGHLWVGDIYASYMEINGNVVWDEGNFNPYVYAPLASPTFTGQVTLTPTTLGTTGTINIDLTGANYRTMASLTGDITFTTSNRAKGRSVTIRIINGDTSRTLTFPSGWVFMGTKPTSIAESKTGVLSITSFGTNDTDIIAVWAVQS